MSLSERRKVMMGSRITSGLAMTLLLFAACGEPTVTTGSDPSASPSPVASAYPRDQLYEGRGLVFQDGEKVALCLGGSTDSIPPHCDERKIRGWSWKGLEYDEMGNVRWGTYTMRGTYIDRVFALKSTPLVPEPYQGGDEGSPCPEPAEGWVIPDPARTREDDLHAARRAAEAQSDFAGVWIDYIIDPRDEEEMQPWGENIVLVLAFTGDPERHEAEAREHWGGALCIWLNDRTEKELTDIRGELGGLAEEFGIEPTWSDLDVQAGVIQFGAIVSSPAFEAELAERYGDAVEVYPALRPVDG